VDKRVFLAAPHGYRRSADAHLTVWAGRWKPTTRSFVNATCPLVSGVHTEEGGVMPSASLLSRGHCCIRRWEARHGRLC
jgi:hypothetical protein